MITGITQAFDNPRAQATRPLLTTTGTTPSIRSGRRPRVLPSMPSPRRQPGGAETAEERWFMTDSNSTLPWARGRDQKRRRQGPSPPVKRARVGGSVAWCRSEQMAKSFTTG